MSKVNYKAILEQVIRKVPHDIDKIETVINMAAVKGETKLIKFNKVIESDIWNVEEKKRLLTALKYQESDHNIRYYRCGGLACQRDYSYAIEWDCLSGFEALIKIYVEVGSMDDLYINIFDAIITECDNKRKELYLDAVLDNLPSEIINRLIEARDEKNQIEDGDNIGIFNYIIASKSLRLIKKYMKYIENINIYLQDAVATGSIEIVKLFLENGADINYLVDADINMNFQDVFSPEKIARLNKESTAKINYLKDTRFVGKLTPLKTAIACGNYEMVKFLIENGADINLQVKCDVPMHKSGNNHLIDYIEQFKYIRTSSALEYAINPRKPTKQHIWFNDAVFNTEVNESLIFYSTENSIKIIDLIFERLEDKSNVNFNGLIALSLIHEDAEALKKYSKYAFQCNYQFDFDILFKICFSSSWMKEEMLILFIDFLAKYDEDNNLCLKLFDYYYQLKFQNGKIYTFLKNEFIVKLLNRIDSEKLKKYCLIPYCGNVETLEYLLSLGFDINQTDEKGRNIVYYLLRYWNHGLVEVELPLFNYLMETEDLDLAAKDNNNKTALYYALQEFDTKDEYLYARKHKVETRSTLEKAIAILVSKMSSQDVCNVDIAKVLERRLHESSSYGEKIDPRCIYQHHKALFSALVNNGFILSKGMLNEIFSSLYPTENEQKETLALRIDVDATLDFLYQTLDYNVEIQKNEITQEFQDLMHSIDSQDMTYCSFIKNIVKFNKKIISADQFYKNNITKRFNPRRYLEYAKNKYHIDYCGLNGYLLMLIIKGIRKFGKEKLLDILEFIPNYDINSYVVDANIGLDYWEYTKPISEDYNIIGEPIYADGYFEAKGVFFDDCLKIVFTGGLMQYAILINDIDMVQLLYQKGAQLEFFDLTWDYVSSDFMAKYLESFIGMETPIDFNDEERSVYQLLFSVPGDKDKK